jgi:hypothetical protein
MGELIENAGLLVNVYYYLFRREVLFVSSHFRKLEILGLFRFKGQNFNSQSISCFIVKVHCDLRFWRALGNFL